MISSWHFASVYECASLPRRTMGFGLDIGFALEIYLRSDVLHQNTNRNVALLVTLSYLICTIASFLLSVWDWVFCQVGEIFARNWSIVEANSSDCYTSDEYKQCSLSRIRHTSLMWIHEGRGVGVTLSSWWQLSWSESLYGPWAPWGECSQQSYWNTSTTPNRGVTWMRKLNLNPDIVL